MTTEFTETVLDLIRQERIRQETKFPGQTFELTDETALRVLMEEVGEAAKDMNDEVAVNDDETFIKEVVQIAAVAVKWAECILQRSKTYELKVVVNGFSEALATDKYLKKYNLFSRTFSDKTVPDVWWVEVTWKQDKESLDEVCAYFKSRNPVMIIVDSEIL